MDTEATMISLFKHQCDALQIDPSLTSTCEVNDEKLRIPSTVSPSTISNVLSSENPAIATSTSSTSDVDYKLSPMSTHLFMSETDFQLQAHTIKDIKTYVKTILFGLKTIIVSLQSLKFMTKNAASALTTATVSSFQHPHATASNISSESLLARYTAISQGKS